MQSRIPDCLSVDLESDFQGPAFRIPLACEQAFLFGQAKRASRERASEGPKKGVLGTNLIPLRTKFDTQTKRVPAWPVINQL